MFESDDPGTEGRCWVGSLIYSSLVVLVFICILHLLDDTTAMFMI